MAWNPLDSDLLSSSILINGPDVVALWTLLLASADKHGESYITVPFVASALQISKERVKAAFEILQAPDLDSRNKELEGRRIVKTDDETGWLIVSHAKYQDKISADRAAMRAAAYRERKRAYATARQPQPPENQ